MTNESKIRSLKKYRHQLTKEIDRIDNDLIALGYDTKKASYVKK